MIKKDIYISALDLELTKMKMEYSSNKRNINKFVLKEYTNVEQETVQITITKPWDGVSYNEHSRNHQEPNVKFRVYRDGEFDAYNLHQSIKVLKVVSIEEFETLTSKELTDLCEEVYQEHSEFLLYNSFESEGLL